MRTWTKLSAGMAVLLQISHAQAQPSTGLKVGGTLDVSIRRVSNGSAGRTTVTGLDGLHNSEVYFGGGEDLGAGWWTGFSLNIGANPDTGSANTPFFNRRSTLSLGGPWGNCARAGTSIPQSEISSRSTRSPTASATSRTSSVRWAAAPTPCCVRKTACPGSLRQGWQAFMDMPWWLPPRAWSATAMRARIWAGGMNAGMPPWAGAGPGLLGAARTGRDQQLPARAQAPGHGEQGHFLLHQNRLHPGNCARRDRLASFPTAGAQRAADRPGGFFPALPPAHGPEFRGPAGQAPGGTGKAGGCPGVVAVGGLLTKPHRCLLGCHSFNSICNR